MIETFEAKWDSRVNYKRVCMDESTLEMFPEPIQEGIPVLLSFSGDETVAQVEVNNTVESGKLYIDPVTASNIGFKESGEVHEVSIGNATVQSAQQVVVQNVTDIEDETVHYRPQIRNHLRKQFIGKYLSSGDMFVVPHEIGNEQFSVVISDFAPKSGEDTVAYFTEDTNIKVNLINPNDVEDEVNTSTTELKPQKKSKSNSSSTSVSNKNSNGVTFSDIGGLNEEITKIREIVQRPLEDPNAFQGVPTPSGVLLYGPPGTGKTMLAKAVSNEVDAEFFPISGAEIFEKNYGESEENLRSLFEEAKEKKPSIIFIDELEALIPSRDELSNTNQVEKRVVTQLKTLMDGFGSDDGVIVLGATNHPNEIDEAFKRPGRFDRQVEISVPDSDEREEILRVHTRNMELKLDEDEITDIIRRTTGYTGSDISNLCREANMAMQRRLLSEYDGYTGSSKVSKILEEENEGYRIEDFENALHSTEPSLLEKFNVDIPDTQWSDIGGQSEIKSKLRQHIDGPLKAPHLWSEEEKSTGVLLHGPPGTGKTMLAKAMATESNRVFIGVQATELKSKWVGETERNIRQLFTLAENLEPSILYIDEIEAIANKRGTHNDTSVSDAATSQMLSALDGLESTGDVIVVGSTNAKYNPEQPLQKQNVKFGVDPALLRPGRLESHFHVSKPSTKEERKEIFDIHLNNVDKSNAVQLDDSISINELAEQTESVSGADIEGICWEAKRIARKQILSDEGGLDNVESETITIKQKHLLDAIEEYTVTTRNETSTVTFQ